MNQRMTDFLNRNRNPNRVGSNLIEKNCRIAEDEDEAGSALWRTSPVTGGNWVPQDCGKTWWQLTRGSFSLDSLDELDAGTFFPQTVLA